MGEVEGMPPRPTVLADDLPHDFECPITNDTMLDPVNPRPNKIAFTLSAAASTAAVATIAAV